LFSAPQLYHRIGDLARSHTDAEIAERLNQAGLSTVKGRPWTARRVMDFRLSNAIPSGFTTTAALRIPQTGYLTSAEAAKQLGVSQSTVQKWYRLGVLSGKHDGGPRRCGSAGPRRRASGSAVEPLPTREWSPCAAFAKPKAKTPMRSSLGPSVRGTRCIGYAAALPCASLFYPNPPLFRLSRQEYLLCRTHRSPRDVAPGPGWRSRSHGPQTLRPRRRSLDGCTG
jgi:excisionase family DNA binding protein